MDSIDFETIAGLASAPVVPINDRNAKALAGRSVMRQPHIHRDDSLLVIADPQDQVEHLKRILQEDGYSHVLTSTDGSEAADLIRKHQPDMVILDWALPNIDGRSILQEVRGDERTADTLIIVLSDSPSQNDAAIKAGATDVFSKPVTATELPFRIERALELRKAKKKLAELSGHLELKVKARTDELLKSRQEAILCLARAAEYRDDDTGQHVTRVGRYSAIIAAELGFPKASVELIEQAAQLHDVGKIGIPDAILRKPGKLDAQEFARMRRHCAIGRQIISPTNDTQHTGDQHTGDQQPCGPSTKPDEPGTSSPVLRMAALIADSHHEKWDGTGYPRGLAGEEIPLAGRIVAVADVFDALASKRPYKEAFPIEKCLSIMIDGRGNHFDPRVLDAFLARKDEFLAVHQQCSERAESPTAATHSTRAINH